MNNIMIRLQMRKVGYNSMKAKGVALADDMYNFLVMLQELYDSGYLECTNFSTDNLVGNLWDKSLKEANPLKVVKDNKEAILSQFVKEILPMVDTNEFKK